MATFNPSGWSPTPEQVQDLSQAIVEEMFVDSPLGDIHEVVTGISHDKQILLYESFAVVGKAITGCVPSEVGDMTITEKQWTPKLMGGRKTYCITDENANQAYFKQAKEVFNDYFERNPKNSELNIVFATLAMAIYNSILPKVWFSSTTADTVDNSGVFTNGTDLGLFNQIEGLWKQIFALGASVRYEIAKNAGTTYDAQMLTSGEGISIVTGVRKKASIVLRANPNAIMLVTQSVFDQLEIDLADKELDNGGITKTFMNGMETIKVLGTQIKAVPNWDITINAYQNDGTKWNLPHRVVMTTKTNIPIGTLSKKDLERLVYKYDDINNKNILDFGYFLDAKVLADELVATGY